MTTEYQEQMNEYMRSQNMNPIVRLSVPLFITRPATKKFALTTPYSPNSPVSLPKATRARVWFSRVWFNPLKLNQITIIIKNNSIPFYVWTCFLWAQYLLCTQNNNASFP